jgi:hypothetical protein
MRGLSKASAIGKETLSYPLPLLNQIIILFIGTFYINFGYILISHNLIHLIPIILPDSFVAYRYLDEAEETGRGRVDPEREGRR